MRRFATVRHRGTVPLEKPVDGEWSLETAAIFGLCLEDAFYRFCEYVTSAWGDDALARELGAMGLL
ncbi:hypothetical protein [Sorangium sp. So ce381]|uniref:hypothetical protein n=1 Tax=Sorangium sp. So ce381 TaxID=3133307 RepID=UPI003F5C0D57